MALAKLPPPRSPENTLRVSFEVPRHLVWILDHHCEMTGLSRSAIIRLSLLNHLSDLEDLEDLDRAQQMDPTKYTRKPRSKK